MTTIVNKAATFLYAIVNGMMLSNNEQQQTTATTTTTTLSTKSNGKGKEAQESSNNSGQNSDFRMPLHYPRYSKADYEAMSESQLDCLLAHYGLPVVGDVHHKRHFAMGAFLWPSQLL